MHTEIKPLHGQPDVFHVQEKSQDFAELFNFTTSGIAIFPLQNKPTLRSHLLHTEPQRHNPPTPCSAYDKSS